MKNLNPYEILNQELKNSNSVDAINAKVTAGAGQPASKGQINLKVSVKVYQTRLYNETATSSTANGGGETIGIPMPSAYSLMDTIPLALANIPGFLQNIKFPVPIFGQNDSASGYKVAFEKLPSLPNTILPLGFKVVGNSEQPLTIQTSTLGTGTSSSVVSIATINKPYSELNASAVKGDLVFTYLASQNLVNGIINTEQMGYNYSLPFYLIDIIINCDTITYGSFLNQLISDKLTLNYIRYTLPTELNLAQFGENILLIKNGMFGASIADTLTPLSFKDGKLYEKNIINIPFSKGIDKHNALATTLTPTNDSFTWILFINDFSKL